MNTIDKLERIAKGYWVAYAVSLGGAVSLAIGHFVPELSVQPWLRTLICMMVFLLLLKFRLRRH